MEHHGKNRHFEAAATARSFVIGQTAIAARPLEPALYLVATPIGNLADITLRALETLAGADIVACEDTRVTRVLLDRYGIRQRPTPYHEHNADEAGPRLIAALPPARAWRWSRMPARRWSPIPAFAWSNAPLAAGIRVVPIPGASAVLAALTASGLPSDTFLFAGFLPVKGGQLRSRLEALKADRRDADLLRIAAPACRNAGRHGRGVRRRPAGGGGARTDQDLRGVAPRHARRACRALSRGSRRRRARSSSASRRRRRRRVAAPEDVDRLLLSLAGEMPASKAAAEAARMTGRPKPELYRRLLELKEPGGWLTQAGRRHKAYRRGHRSEWLAALALMLKGYRIVARRYRTKLGEIDLIARRGDLVLIVEVKARPTLMEAMEAIARESERRIEGAADLWLARQKDYGRLSVRFDMVAVLPRRWPVHVENAFHGRS